VRVDRAAARRSTVVVANQSRSPPALTATSYWFYRNRS